MMTEAYTSMDMIMRFYESDDGTEQRAHFPFNFAMITELDAGSKARDFKYVIDRFLENMPRGKITNWVVIMFHSLGINPFNTMLHLPDSSVITINPVSAAATVRNVSTACC